MRFPFHLIINYAHTKPEEINNAFREFFGSTPSKGVPEEIQGLFGEWLIFEFRNTQGVTFLAEYTLKNPDKLPQPVINQFEQIIKTHFYSEFQMVSVHPPEYIEIEDIVTGKIYKVYDKKGSQNSQNKGLIRTRIAEVNNRWYLIGANPIFIPMVYTTRMKKILIKEKFTHPALIDTKEMLMNHYANPPQPPKIPTKEEMTNKLHELEYLFDKAGIKYNTTMTYEKLSQAIYEEDRANVLDFWKSLTRKGLSEEFLLNEFQLLQDMWNYLPHKCLNGQSPIELYAKLRRRR